MKKILEERLKEKNNKSMKAESFEDVPRQPLSPETVKKLSAIINRLLEDVAWKTTDVNSRGKLFTLGEDKEAAISQFDQIEDHLGDRISEDLGDESTGIVAIHHLPDRTKDVVYETFSDEKTVHQKTYPPEFVELIRSTLKDPSDQQAFNQVLDGLIRRHTAQYQIREAREEEVEELMRLLEGALPEKKN